MKTQVQFRKLRNAVIALFPQKISRVTNYAVVTAFAVLGTSGHHFPVIGDNILKMSHPATPQEYHFTEVILSEVYGYELDIII